MKVRLLGIDPGLANLGVTVGTVCDGNVSIDDIFVFSTQKSSKKRNLLAGDDMLRRACLVSSFLDGVFDDFGPIVCMCVESMSFPRNASSAAKMAVVWGILSSLSTRLSVPIVQASPQEIKLAICGRRDASKKAVATAVDGLTGATVSAILRAKGINAGRHEHAFDSAAALLTCRDSQVIEMVSRLV